MNTHSLAAPNNCRLLHEREQALVALYDRIFLLSQSFIPAVNAPLLGSWLYRSRLVPRVLPLLGFSGAALLVADDAAKLFDPWGPMSSQGAASP